MFFKDFKESEIMFFKEIELLREICQEMNFKKFVIFIFDRVQEIIKYGIGSQRQKYVI